MKKLGYLLFALVCLSGCAVTDELSGDSDADEENPEEVVAGSEAALTGSSLRVMSYNIKYGAECGLDMNKLAAVIKESNPDIIGLQEVDEGTRRSGNKKETDDLASLTGMQHRYFGANFDYDGGKYGLAILSKYPLVNPRVVRLDNRTTRENGYEPRIAVTADINVGGKKITFVTVHASLHDEEHDGNANAILNNAIGGNKSRALVVGDFNEKPSETIGDKLTGAGLVDAFHEKHRFFGYTAPANFPIRRIDFIYRGSALGKTAHAWVPNTKASDHRPVAAVIPLQ
jgi:endonuclease/exonuclease/phosphatase family metal-dependent hydrolase